MSDLCLYEFEDIVWDEFCQSDDHIVPHPGLERAADHSVLGDSHKKPHLEVTCISNSTGDNRPAAYGDEGREQGGLSSLNERRNKMLENDSCSHEPNDVLPSSSGSGRIKDASSLASENNASTSHPSKSNNIDSKGDEICVNDAILGDRIDAVDNNSFADTLGDITHTDTNLDFFENAEDKDSSDMLYYGWPDIGNFEDVDRMFRSCDSTFGFAAIKDDELGWFPSADNIQESGDVVKPDFKFPYVESNPVENISQNHDSSNCSSVNDSTMTSAPTRFKDFSWISEKSDSHISFVNGPAMINSKDGFIPRQQMIEQRKQVKLQNRSIGKRKEQKFRNGSSFSYMSNVPNGVVQPPPCYMNSDTSPLSDLTSLNPISGVKSETNDLTSPSPRDSHASNQLQLNSRDPAFSLSAPEGSGKRENLHNCEGSRYSAYNSEKKASSTVQAVIGDPGSIEEQVHYSRDNTDNHSNILGCSPVIPAELGLGEGQEKSMSSGIDTSLEAASFRQLQLVMEQLDPRTKICIRDSLYRLARSAEQRHNHANLNGSCGDEREANGAYMGEGTHNFMDIETDTNPIDRSIAHLLFHRPSESSTMPAHGSLPLKSPNAVPGTVTGPTVMVEDLVVCDETASAMKKASDTDCRC